MTTLPTYMNAMLLVGHGGVDKLEWRSDAPTPVPGPGEVVIAVDACGLNNTDINTRTAWYAAAVTDGTTNHSASDAGIDSLRADATWTGQPLTFPRIQGADVVGTAAALGEGVDRGLLNRRVMIDPWVLDSDDPNDLSRARYLGSEIDGGFAQYTKVPAKNVVPVSSTLSDAELATFACSYTTAETMLGRADVQRDEVVVVTGASGGVGTAAIQLAKARDATVIAIAGAAKGHRLLALGADSVIDRRVDDLSSAVVDAAPDGRIDVIADVVGSSMFSSLVPLLAAGGRYTSCGAISGPLVEFDLRHLIYRDLRFIGTAVCPPGTMRRVVDMIEAGAIRPVLHATYPLEELAVAQEAFEIKQHVGNIVVTVDTTSQDQGINLASPVDDSHT